MKTISAKPKESENILAFDSSLARSAWAGHCANGWVWDCRSFITPTDKEFPDLRFNDWRNWAERALEKIAPSVVIYEKPTPRGGAHGAPQIMLEMTLRELCALRRIPVKVIYPAALKKHITQNGKAEKAEMMAAVALRIPEYSGVEDEGGDIADALAMVLWFQAGAPESDAAIARKAKKAKTQSTEVLRKRPKTKKPKDWSIE